MSKTQIMLDYLLQCPAVSDLYFQYGQMHDGSQQINTQAVETATQTPFIDGTQAKRLDFSFVWAKPLLVIPVIPNGGTPQTVADLDDVQGVIDWITANNAAHILPAFDGCIVDGIKCLTDTPQMAGVDTSYSPPLARYRFTIRVDFIDLTGRNWDD